MWCVPAYFTIQSWYASAVIYIKDGPHGSVLDSLILVVVFVAPDSTAIIHDEQDSMVV